jgi:hypothetical protein
MSWFSTHAFVEKRTERSVAEHGVSWLEDNCMLHMSGAYFICIVCVYVCEVFCVVAVCTSHKCNVCKLMKLFIVASWLCQLLRS